MGELGRRRPGGWNPNNPTLQSPVDSIQYGTHVSNVEARCSLRLTLRSAPIGRPIHLWRHPKPQLPLAEGGFSLSNIALIWTPSFSSQSFMPSF